MKRFALAGNPNSGKTTLFNSLTGSTAHVGNWPGVTVEKKDGIYKKCKEAVQIVDLPGIYSLSPYTSEEVISRNFIIDEKPDCVINIVDATNLERNLYLTTQILEMNVPMVVALNMMDVLEKNGDRIDCDLLSKKIGVPVVLISAQTGENLEELMNVAYETSLTPREGKSVLEGSRLQHLILDVKTAFTGLDVENPLFHAIKLIENDDIEIQNHPRLIKIVDEFKKTFADDKFGTDLEAIIADERYKYITSEYVKARTRTKIVNKFEQTTSDKIDKVLTNKWAGIPIFLLILFAIFHLTFSENFLYLGGLLNIQHASFEGTAFEGLFWTTGGINSPGFILFQLMGGITGQLAEWIAAGVDAMGASAWAAGLINDGIFAGIFAVLSFVPQILTIFLFFSLLEDSGYMSRVVFILDRIFRKFGLSGRAFIPMIMGFGCSVPAIVNTRTLADEKEKVATIRVIPFFSCGAKLPILTAIAGAIVSQFGVGNADLITFGMYVIGIATAIVTVLFMRKTTMRGEIPPFVMELPAYHAPQFRSTMIHMWDKLKHYVKKAFTIILASTVLIWFLTNFKWDWTMVEDGAINESIIASIGQLFTPIFTPLGFGSQLNPTMVNGTPLDFTWVFVVAAVTGLIAKENVIATFGVLAACIAAAGAFPELAEDEEGITYVQAMITATGITLPALIAFIVFNMTTIPCFAAVATTKSELTKKQYHGTLIFWIVTSFIVSSIVYVVGSWWWTVFIFIAAIAAIIVALHYYDRWMNQRELAKAGL